MKIEVLETATVFEGEETVYRYDLTAPGISAGGECAKEVVDQTQELMGEAWGKEPVRIDAPSNVVAVLTAAFAGVGVLVQGDVEKRNIEPHTARRLHIPPPVESQRPVWFYPALGLVVCCVGAACWWSMRPEQPMAKGGVAASVSATPKAQAVSQAPEPEPLPGVELVHGPVRVRLPEGFHIHERDDGALTASGPDAELRILLAVDPAYGVSSDAVYHEVELMIERDPALTLHSGERFRDHAVRTIDYREDPGDGTFVSWVTWVEADHQFSIGCHTKTEPTIPQLAACRMAAGTLQLHLDGGASPPPGTERQDSAV